MPILSSKDPCVDRIINENGLLRDADLLGAGTFCMTFTGKKSTRVFKLTADKTHHAYLTDGTCVGNLFKPRVYNDFGVIGKTAYGVDVFLLEVERLKDLVSGSNHEKLVSNLIYFENVNGRLPESKKDAPALDPELFLFMRSLNKFVNMQSSARFDLCESNFMQRKNGRLIFNDPVCDSSLWEGYSWSSGSS